jgi:uncharacterized protein
MSKNRQIRLLYALAVTIALVLIGRNLYYRIVNAALVAAVRNRDVSAVRRLLTQGADPNALFSDLSPNGQPLSPKPIIALACAKLRESTSPAPIAPGPGPAQAEEIALLLIRHGARFQGGDYLESACLCGDVALARELLDRGMDPNAPGNTGVLSTAINYNGASEHRFVHTPEEKAEMARRLGVSQQLVRLLREHGAQLSLLQAQAVEDTATVQKLMAAGGPAVMQQGYLMMARAAREGDLKTLRQLLQLGVDPNRPLQPDPSNYAIPEFPDDTPLEAAVNKSQVEAVRLLLTHGADPNIMGVHGEWPALTYAAGAGDLEIVKLLLAHGAKLNGASSYVLQANLTHMNVSIPTALEQAISLKRPTVVRYLLAQGAATATSPDTVSLLTLALRYLPDVMPNLLKRGAPVNLPSSRTLHARDIGSMEPHSPLMAALFYVPQYEATLVRAGAKIGPDRSLVCSAAAQRKRLDLLPKLLAYGADINGADSANDPALSICVMSAPAVKMLLEHGANPNVLSHDKRTPLQLAALTGNIEVVRLLLAHGAQVNAHIAHDHTALYWAHNKDHPDIVALLQQAGGQE